MLRYEDYNENDEKDTCEVCEEQIAYVFALGLTKASSQIGK